MPPPPRARTLSALALPLLLLLPACASGDTAADATVDSTAAADVAAAPSTPSAALRDACTVLSAEEVSAAAGLGASTGQPSESGGAQVCTWMDANGKAAIVQLYATAARYEESRTAFESLYGGTAEALAGVADQAFYIGGRTGSIPTATVSVRKGRTAASVQVMAMSGDATGLRSQVMELTQQLVAKL